MEQVIIGFPYYKAESHDNSENRVTLTFSVTVEGSLGGATEDNVADAVRDYLAGLSGVTGSSLIRRSNTQTSL
jgi:hypothetical protein